MKQHMNRAAEQAGTRSTALRAAAIGAALWLAAAGTAAAAGAFDGTYTGHSKRIQGRDSTCSNDFRLKVQVVDGAFDLMWLRSQNIELHITIANDGTVSGTRSWGRGGARVSASGTVKPGELEIEVKGVECVRHLSLKRV